MHYTNDAWWRVWHAKIYMSRSWNVNTRACPSVDISTEGHIYWHGTWVRHVSSVLLHHWLKFDQTLSKTYILLARNDTIQQLRHDIITSHHECKPRPQRHFSQWARARLCLRIMSHMWHYKVTHATLYMHVNKARYTLIGWAKPDSEICCYSRWHVTEYLDQ